MEQVDSLGTEQKFKKTEIGEIPVDWSLVRMGEITERIIDNRGKTPPLSSEGYELIEVNAIEANSKFPNYKKVAKYVDKETYLNWFRDEHPATSDVLIPTVGTLGVTAIMNENRGCIAQNIVAIRVNSKTNPDFFYYYTNCNIFIKQIKQVVMSAVQPSLKVPHLLKFFIPIPPLPEQKKIAEILTIVDEAIEKSDSIIEKTKELKKGLMQELLTNGIGHEKFKKTEIGEIPVDWAVVKMGDICEVVGGSTPSTNEKEYWNGDILWAVPTDITKLKGNIISNTGKKITKTGLSACAAKLLPEGSILLTSRATIGACAINTKPMATNQGFASLICKANAYNWFVFYKIVSMSKELRKLGSGSTFKETSKKSIRAIRISIPHLPEQKKIAEILSSVDEEIEKETANKGKLEWIKKGLMQVLLTGKKRVKV